MSATHLLNGAPDEFERGFQLGVIWARLGAGDRRFDVVVPVTMVRRATRLAEAVGYRAMVRKPPGLPGLRFMRFSSVRGG